MSASVCYKCGADLTGDKLLIRFQYRGRKEDILKQIFKIEGVYAWNEVK